MPIAARSPRQALGDRGVSEEGGLVMGSPAERRGLYKPEETM